MESKRKGVFAFAKQTAKGDDAAAPLFALPKNGGGIRPTTDKEALPLTTEGAQRWGNYKQRARAAGTVTVLAHPEALGLLLYEVCGAQAVTGVGVPFEHEFTVVDTVPFNNPLTVWDMVGGDWWKFTDVYVTKLTIRGSEGGLVYCEFDVIGYQATPVAAPVYTLVAPDPRFKYIGTTVELEADDDVPVEVTNVNSVELVIDRAPSIRYGSSLVPVTITPERMVDFSVGLVYDTSGNNQGWDYLKAAHLGDVAGTELSQDLPKGSFRVSFGRHPELAGRELTIAGNGQNWEYDVARPDSDPGGGDLEMDVAGVVVRPDAGGTEVTITLANETAGLY